MSDYCGDERDPSLQCRCPYSGRTWGNLRLAQSLDPSCFELAGGNHSVLTGEDSSQWGSQFWMDANPTGTYVYPGDVVASAYGSADYARDWVTMNYPTMAVGYPKPALSSQLMNTGSGFPIGLAAVVVVLLGFLVMKK